MARQPLRAIERYITDTLDESERIRLKLLNPLGVAQSLAGRYGSAVSERLKLLQDDFTTINSIERQIELYKVDLQKDFRLHLLEIENMLNEMELRGMQFFDDTVRLTRMFDLLRADKVRADFEDKVIADTPAQMEQRIQKVIDWLVERQFRLWQSATEYLDRRRSADTREGMLGTIGASFDYNRSELLSSVGETARKVVNTYDRNYEIGGGGGRRAKRDGRDRAG